MLAKSSTESDLKRAVNRERQLSDPPVNTIDGELGCLFLTITIIIIIFEGVSSSLEDSDNPRPRVLSLEMKRKAMKKRYQVTNMLFLLMLFHLCKARFMYVINPISY